MIIVSVAAAASGGSVAVSGVVNTLVVSNSVKAGVGAGSRIFAGYTREPETAGSSEIRVTESSSEGSEGSDVYIEAFDESFVVEVAGALSASGGTGVGASVVVLVFNKTVEADAGSAAVIKARRNVIVSAETVDNMWLLGLSLGAAGTTGVAGGVNVMFFRARQRLHLVALSLHRAAELMLSPPAIPHLSILQRLSEPAERQAFPQS